MPVQRLTPQRRRELTRTALVEAAAEVFSEKGLRGASLDEIADRAGFTRGAIYSNFGSKEELLLAVLDWYSRTTLEAYWEAGRTGEWDPATAARVWSRVVRSDPRLDLLHMEFRLHALRDPSFRRRLAEAHRESMDSFQYEFRQGGVEFGLDSHGNQIAPAEVAAFYRILFGHQHEIAIGEFEVCGSKRVVVRERVSREREPHARKSLEKPLGIADSGDRVQFLSGKLGLR